MVKLFVAIALTVILASAARVGRRLWRMGGVG